MALTLFVKTKSYYFQGQDQKLLPLEEEIWWPEGEWIQVFKNYLRKNIYCHKILSFGDYRDELINKRTAYKY
jgi:hypothetical protein